MLLLILSVLAAVSTCVIPAFGQQTCQDEILHNSTIDIDKYLNKELHILATFPTPPPDAISNCTLQCCNQGNCSLAIYNASNNHTCILIHCVSEEACKPIPSNGSEMIKAMRNNMTTTGSLSENQNQTTELSLNTSTAAPGISSLTTMRGDHSTSLQQSTTQDYNDSFTSNIGDPTTPFIETSQSTNEISSTTFSVSTSSVSSGQNQISTTESTSLQNTDISSPSPANTTNQNYIFSNTTPSSSTTDVFTSSNSSSTPTTSHEGMTTNYNDSTENFNTTTTTLINNETESSNHTIIYVTPNLSENGNVSITDDANVTFSQDNDITNSTIDNSTESFHTTTTTTTLTKNESDILNYTNTYFYPNSSDYEYINVTVAENTTFSQSNDTVNSTIDSNLNQNSTEFPNATFSKQEANLKNEADSNNSLMITVLIGTLSVGTLLFVAVIAVISKKIIDGWQKRHYSRIDYLVNGMYN